MNVGESNFCAGGVVEWCHYAATGETSIRVMARPGGALMYTATRCPHTPTEPADQDHVWLATWSVNMGVPEALERAGVVGPCVKRVQAGYGWLQLHPLTAEAKADRALAYAADPFMSKDRQAVLDRMAAKAAKVSAS